MSWSRHWVRWDGEDYVWDREPPRAVERFWDAVFEAAACQGFTSRCVEAVCAALVDVSVLTGRKS